MRETPDIIDAGLRDCGTMGLRDNALPQKNTPERVVFIVYLQKKNPPHGASISITSDLGASYRLNIFFI